MCFREHVHLMSMSKYFNRTKSFQTLAITITLLHLSCVWFVWCIFISVRHCDRSYTRLEKCIRQFHLDHLENSPVFSAKNPIQMENNNYSGQVDPFHLQSYNGMPTPITYPNPNPPVRPPNVFYPPIDFSVPPPNFAQMNVSTQ